MAGSAQNGVVVGLGLALGLACGCDGADDGTAAGGAAGAGAAAPTGGWGSTGAGGAAGGAATGGGAGHGGDAQHRLLLYGFEDWAGSAEASPGYPFGAPSEAQWADHTTRTTVLESCGAWTAASGSYFLFGDWYAGADACLAADGGAPFIFLGAPFSAGNPAAFSIADRLPHDQLFLRFRVRLGDGWKTNTNHCVKFVRPRWAGGGYADYYSNVIYYCGADNYVAAPGFEEGYWEGAFALDTLGIDLSDGLWHQFAALEDISRLREHPPGPLHVTVWVDGQQIIDRDVPVNASYVADNGPVGFQAVNLLENFCGTDNDGPVTYGFDDVEVWDAAPLL